jgi:predicted nuclease of predicted toxin-antitoxin system
MNRLILDQGLPPQAAELLRGRDIPATHVSELGMAESSDSEILEFAIREGAALATLDRDFPNIVAMGALTTPSVIFIRLTSLKAAATADLLAEIFVTRALELESGVILTVDTRGLRVRRLPIVWNTGVVEPPSG